MKDLISVGKDGAMLVSSKTVAARFGKRHDNVLQSIKRLDCPDDFRALNYQECFYANDLANGKTQLAYNMTRDGFTILAMGFTGKEAIAWKIKFLEAFKLMERELLKKSDKLEWKQARLQGKEVRRSTTDTIAEFVEYAMKQNASSGIKHIFSTLTREEYKALGLLEKGEKVPTGFRDTLDILQISHLLIAERIARQWIQKGMDDGLHYKDIYQLAKSKIVAFADSLKLVQLI